MSGLIRRIDDLGRIAIPREIRHPMGIVVGMPMEISYCAEQGMITIKKYSTVDDLLERRLTAPALAALRAHTYGCAYFMADFLGQPIGNNADMDEEGLDLDVLEAMKSSEQEQIIKGSESAAVPIVASYGKLAGYIVIIAEGEDAAKKQANLENGIQNAALAADMLKEIAG